MSTEFLPYSGQDPDIVLTGKAPARQGWATSEVDRIWAIAIEDSGANGHLFDGQALFVDSIGNLEISLFQLPYRFLYAQRRSPQLREQLNLRPIAVSGVCLSDGKMLLGVRSRSATQYPGFLELVPSGGLGDLGEHLDYKHRLIEELEEETSIARTSVIEISTIGICFDQEENTYDLCCRILLQDGLSLEQTSSPKEEYSDLIWRDTGSLLAEKDGPEIVPTSLAIVEHLFKAARAI
ncbi:MAG: hypothetical protein AB7W16_10760 [Candidatus Obscuribacterales bacterium]